MRYIALALVVAVAGCDNLEQESVDDLEYADAYDEERDFSTARSDCCEPMH